MVQVGFSNGIGNFVVFTQILQCLSNYFEDKIHLFLDDGVDIVDNASIKEMALKLPFVKKVSFFPEEYDQNAFRFMSQLNNPGALYDEFVGLGIDFSTFKGWSLNYVSETAFYLHELNEKIPYRGKLPPQRVPYLKTSLLKSYGVSQYICIANGYSPGFERKAYSRWGETIALFKRLYGHSIVLLGGKSDIGWGEEILDEHPETINLIGKTSILEASTIVRGADLLLSTDTGLYHIADAFQVPSVVLFGSTLISKNGPINRSVKTVTTPRMCAPCQATPFWNMCEDRNECLDLIEPVQILLKVRSILPNILTV